MTLIAGNILNPHNFAIADSVTILHTQIILGGGQGTPARRLRRLERNLLLLEKQPRNIAHLGPVARAEVCSGTIHNLKLNMEEILEFLIGCVPGSVMGTISMGTSILSWPSPLALFFAWKAAISTLCAFTPLPSFFLLQGG